MRKRISCLGPLHVQNTIVQNVESTMVQNTEYTTLCSAAVVTERTHTNAHTETPQLLLQKSQHNEFSSCRVIVHGAESGQGQPVALKTHCRALPQQAEANGGCSVCIPLEKAVCVCCCHRANTHTPTHAPTDTHTAAVKEPTQPFDYPQFFWIKSWNRKSNCSGVPMIGPWYTVLKKKQAHTLTRIAVSLLSPLKHAWLGMHWNLSPFRDKKNGDELYTRAI